MQTQVQMPIPLASTTLAVALTAYSVFKPPRGSHTGREFAIELVIVLVVAAVTFAATARAIRSANPAKPSGRAALTLAVVGVLSVLAFSVGNFSVALAGGSALLALEARRRARERGDTTTAATVALAIAATTVPLSVLIAIVA